MQFLRRVALFLGTELCLAANVFSQTVQTSDSPILEEIIVTATRVATNLQETPLSVAAFTAERNGTRLDGAKRRCIPCIVPCHQGLEKQRRVRHRLPAPPYSPMSTDGRVCQRSRGRLQTILVQDISRAAD
jgi:hypothetical protein